MRMYLWCFMVPRMFGPERDDILVQGDTGLADLRLFGSARIAIKEIQEKLDRQGWQ